MNLYLIRGLPGSGKSTLAQRIISSNPNKKYAWYEADMFFVDENGNYKFEPSKIRQAHEWCQRMTLTEGIEKPQVDHVIVSNTFSQYWELKPYIEMGLMNGMMVVVIESALQFKNVHNVPEEKIIEMDHRWETNGRIGSNHHLVARHNGRLSFRIYNGDYEFLSL